MIRNGKKKNEKEKREKQKPVESKEETLSPSLLSFFSQRVPGRTHGIDDLSVCNP